MSWKTADGKVEASHLVGQLETLIVGMLDPTTLLDLLRHFIVFERSKQGRPEDTGVTTISTVKKIAAYHQYYAVNRAVVSTMRATGRDKAYLRRKGSRYRWWPNRPRATACRRGQQPSGDRKGGVVWHTQGSGKSLSMVFYTGKIVLALDNPTVVVITDRNDLDDQLFDTFAAAATCCGRNRVQVESREHLKELLRVASGGVVFSTIQKFQPEEGNVYEQLIGPRQHRGDRRRSAPHAIRVQGPHGGCEGRSGRSDRQQDRVRLRQVPARCAAQRHLPVASPARPSSSTDVNTPRSLATTSTCTTSQQAVEDGATVRIYYESRLAKVNLKRRRQALIEQLDELSSRKEKAPTRRRPRPSGPSWKR
jgi:type I restriction enzyme R subunit